MKKTHLHPLALRIWHWLNALMVIALIATGILLRVPGIAALGRNDPALLVHKYVGWAMTASCAFWFAYGLITNHLRRQYGIRRKDLQGTYPQAKYYVFSMFKGEGNPFQRSPEAKFNPLQKLTYGVIMFVFAPILVATGVLLSDILIFRKYILLWNVMGILDAVHVLGAYVIALYIVVHLYMATMGSTTFSHIKAMIVGYEEEPDEPAGAGTEKA